MVKVLACSWYFSSILFFAFFFVLELNLTRQLNVLLGIALKITFVCVLYSLRHLVFGFSFRLTWNSSSLSAFQNNSRLWYGEVFVVIYNTSSCLFLDGIVFGIQSSHVNFKYSLPESLFTLLWKSSLHNCISESDFLPLNTNNPSSLYIRFHRNLLD